MKLDNCIFFTRLTRLAGILAAIGLFQYAPNAFAANPDLYQATVPVTDHSEQAQTAAFQAALKLVLSRITGERSSDQDAALAPLLANARQYVQQYRPAADNQMAVVFDGPAIERWLSKNGRPVWGQERPATFVVLAVQTPAPGAILAADSGAPLKGVIDAAASARGIRLVWPSAVDLRDNHLDYAAATAASVAGLGDIGRRLGAAALLVGRAPDAGAAATVHWSHVYQDRSAEFLGGAEGVNRAADIYAGAVAASAASSGGLAPIDLEISGINDVRAYAGLQSYMESLTFVSRVSILSLSGDSVRFRVTTRSGPEPLQHALANYSHLQQMPAEDNGIQHYQVRR